MGKIYFLLLTLTFFFISAFTDLNSFEIKSGNNLTSLDNETVNWLSRIDSAGGTVSDSIISAVDDYIKEVKGLKYQSVNIRDLLLRENWFCGDFNAAFVPVFRNPDGTSSILGSYTDKNHNYSAAEYLDTGLNSGLKGNGVNRYIETGFNPYQIEQISKNDVHFMIYNISNSADAGKMGCRGNFGDGFYFYPKNTDGNTYFNLNSTAESNVVIPSPNSYILVQRISSQIVNSYYRDNLINSLQNNSTYEPNAAIAIGAFNNNGTISNYLSMQLGGYSIGKSFTQSQQLIHYNAVHRLMNRLGRFQNNNNEVDFKSKLFTFTGDRLNINFETHENGYIKFELQNSNGNPVPDFSLQDCPSMSGNSFSQDVIWNSGNNLSSLINTPVFLRIKMSDADLYTIQFKDQLASTDSSADGFKAGTYKQFFADTTMFGNNIPVIRKMHTPVKNRVPVISPTQPWEGDMLITSYSNIDYSKSIFLDQMVYKMWIRASFNFSRIPVYYESADGTNWMRPNLESFKLNGGMNNNVISDNPDSYGGFMTVIDDSLYNRTDSTMRYKSIYNTHTTRFDTRLNVSFSSDGLLWIPYSGNPVRFIGEDLSSSGWNPVIGNYLGYFRDSLGIRKIGRYVSDDWINWNYTGTVLSPDANDIKTTDYYNMEVLFKDSVYWGLLGHYQMNANGDENPLSPSRSDNTVFIELLFSKDGINFVRCGNRQPFLNYGELSSWDDQMVFTVGVPVAIGNEFFIYYNGFNFKHMSTPPPPADGGPPKSQIGLAKIGLDRFVSLTSF